MSAILHCQRTKKATSELQENGQHQSCAQNSMHGVVHELHARIWDSMSVVW